MKSTSDRKLPFRPRQAYWFETYTPRHQTVYALDAFSRTGLVQLESSPDHAVPLYIGKIKQSIREFDKLHTKYERYLPTSDQYPADMIVSPEEEAEKALTLIQKFAASLDHSQVQLAEKEQWLNNLYLLNEYLETLTSVPDKLARISHDSDFLYKRLFACPKPGLKETLDTTVHSLTHGTKYDFYTIIDLPDKTDNIDHLFLDTGCKQITVPHWLPSDSQQQRNLIEKSIRELEATLASQDHHLHASQTDPKLEAAVTNIAMLRWYVDNPGIEDIDSKMCHITGWAKTNDVSLLQDELDKLNIPAIVRFSVPPMNVEPPVSMLQTWWSKPFHLFVRMMGTPGASEIDPSFVLPAIIPLLFGYMFPDVGHGIIMAIAGFLLQRHWPSLKFLIPCGVVASIFGVIFGEVFGLHHIIPALWVQPLEHPVHVLIAPMIFGVFLMLLGLIFNGVEAYWRYEFYNWLLADAAIIFIYAGAILAIFYPVFLWLTTVALAWYLLGSLILHRRNLQPGILQATGNLVVSTMELGLNTLSFLRVGAFALAHAALTTGIMEITSNIHDDTIRIITLIILHIALIIGEGFIVFIQTIRLVLFEFFIRFLHAEGRVFKPSILTSR